MKKVKKISKRELIHIVRRNPELKKELQYSPDYIECYLKDYEHSNPNIVEETIKELDLINGLKTGTIVYPNFVESLLGDIKWNAMYLFGSIVTVLVFGALPFILIFQNSQPIWRYKIKHFFKKKSL